MKRRKILKYGLAGSASLAAAGTIGWHSMFDGPLHNPCQMEPIPESIVNHPLMKQAFSGIDFSRLWDLHFHLIGNGMHIRNDGIQSGAWITPKLTSWFSPTQRLQYHFYMNAACIEQSEKLDPLFVENILRMANQLPDQAKFMLLAFDFLHGNNGTPIKESSTFYTPNEYAAIVAATSDRFEWIASVHPYRKDAIDSLEWCKAKGAKAIKWLPPAMNIDPSSNKCKRFYQKLIDLELPLLSHAGEEKAVHSEDLQQLSNPLYLRIPLDMGVTVIVAHCASLGESADIESKTKKMTSNFALFSRLMNEPQYRKNCFGDISAINLINRKPSEIKQLIENQSWHSRLLYGSDFPLPGVMPIISTKQLIKNNLLDESKGDFLNSVRPYNAWLYDFLVKRFMKSGGISFSNDVFHTRDLFT